MHKARGWTANSVQAKQVCLDSMYTVLYLYVIFALCNITVCIVCIVCITHCHMIVICICIACIGCMHVMVACISRSHIACMLGFLPHRPPCGEFISLQHAIYIYQFISLIAINYDA